MYISLAESRAKGFMKWANTYQPGLVGRSTAAFPKSLSGEVIAGQFIADLTATCCVAPPHQSGCGDAHRLRREKQGDSPCPEHTTSSPSI